MVRANLRRSAVRRSFRRFPMFSSSLSRPRQSSICEPLESRRLLAAGELDYSFGGGDGFATINFPGAPFVVHDVALQSNGKLIAVGSKAGILAVTRLNVDGSLDTTFAGGGLFESTASYAAGLVAVQADDKIVL